MPSLMSTTYIITVVTTPNNRGRKICKLRVVFKMNDVVCKQFQKRIILIKRTKLEKSRNSCMEGELPLPGEASGIGAHVLQTGV